MGLQVGCSQYLSTYSQQTSGLFNSLVIMPALLHGSLLVHIHHMPWHLADPVEAIADVTDAMALLGTLTHQCFSPEFTEDYGCLNPFDHPGVW